MFYILIYGLLFFGAASLLVYLLGLARLVRLSRSTALLLLPGLLFGLISFDAFILGGVIVGNILPSPMALFFLFGGLLLIPLNLLLLGLLIVALMRTPPRRA